MQEQSCSRLLKLNCFFGVLRKDGSSAVRRSPANMHLYLYSLPAGGSTRHAQAAEGVHGSSVCLEPSTTRCSASTRGSTIYSIQHVFYRQTFGGGLRWSPSREGREDLLPDAKRTALDEPVREFINLTDENAPARERFCFGLAMRRCFTCSMSVVPGESEEVRGVKPVAGGEVSLTVLIE